MVLDSFDRSISYLRMSVTDHCNLRCSYCMPFGHTGKIRHEEILSYEEITRLIGVLVRAGIEKVRITGGEPLVRSGIGDLLKSIAETSSRVELCLTTNGVLLGEKLHDVYAAGIRKINISLDTLDPKKYRDITSRPFWHSVWNGIEKAIAIPDIEAKVNVVVMRGINDDEIESFFDLAWRYPLQVRFIEFMPIGCGSRWNHNLYVAGQDIMQRMMRLSPLLPVPRQKNGGPAIVYKPHGAMGEVGLISPVSSAFCNSCNRIRITPDGHLRTCLFSDNECDLKEYLRSDMQDNELEEVLKKAIRKKPLEHGRILTSPACNRQMSQIGG